MTLRKYLKYSRLVRTFMKAKYNLTQADLDCLCFLYDEDEFDINYFTLTIFLLLPFELARLYRLVNEGYLKRTGTSKFRNRQKFKISRKGLAIVNQYYEYLEGDDSLIGLPRFHNKNNPFNKSEEKMKYRDRQAKKFYKNMRDFQRKGKFDL